VACVGIEFDSEGNFVSLGSGSSPEPDSVGGTVSGKDPDHFLILEETGGTSYAHFLVDDQAVHGVLALVPTAIGGSWSLVGTLEKGAVGPGTWMKGDILGSKNGYGYSNSSQVGNLAIFSPASLIAVSGAPDFTLTMSWGWILLGGFDSVMTPYARLPERARVTGT